MRSTALALAFVALTGSCAFAQTPRLLAAHESWSAWTFQENRTKVCYVYADALTRKPETLDHGRVGFSVRRLKNGKTRTEAGFLAGYPFAPREIRVSINGRNVNGTFRMIPRGQHAWLRREEREGEFVQALLKGRTMTVEAVSKRGNRTSYSFSLKGVTAAMKAARRACP